MQAELAPSPGTDIERLFALSRDLLCVAGGDGYFKRVNPAFTRALGWRAEELLARPFLQFVHPDDHARTIYQIHALADGAPVHGFENRYRCTDGSWRWISWSITPEPRAHLVYAVGRDITEQRRLEEALREAEQRLRAVYGALTCGVLVLDAAGEVVDVNAAGQEILGLRLDELRGRFAANGHVLVMLREDGSAMPPEERPSYRALATGAPVRDVVMGFWRLDGTERWVQMEAVPLLDGAGAVRHVVASFTDITALHQAERALRRETERRAAIIAAQQDVAEAGLDLEAVLACITERARALTGAEGAVVEMIDGEDMLYRAASGLAAAHIGLRLPIATSLSGICARDGGVLRCDDTEADARADRSVCRRLGIRSMILAPLRQAGRTIGVLKVLASRPHAFEAHDVEALQMAAGVLGAALGQATAFAALRTSEERYRQVEAHAPIGLALVSPDGRFLRVNPALCALVGYTEEELRARTFQ